MKTKLFFVIAFTLFVQIANAQRLGIKGGVNFANVTVSGGGVSMSPSGITGFQLGLVGDFKLQDKLHFNTGLLYSLKGFKSGTTTDKINYLEVPLNFAYNFSINETSDFFVQAGPYLAYGLSGTDKTDGVSTDIFSDGYAKRLDYGLGFGAGVQFGSIVTSVNYELGLANLNDDSTSDLKLKTKTFQVSIAYMFGK